MNTQQLSPQKLRFTLFAIAASIALLSAASLYFKQFRETREIVAVMAVCIVYVLLRAVFGRRRRELASARDRWAGTRMAWNRGIEVQLTAAQAWDLFELTWVALDLTACMLMGIPGVFAAVFQFVFYYGFRESKTLRPDLYDTAEKCQSMDMLEAILYAQACSVLLIAALILD